MAIARLRDYQGPALLSYGFRPFFLFGALYSGLSVMLWMPQFYGELQLASLFAPVDWHIHEMFFGYLAAIVTGFLFTAVPNWTGRMPLQGAPLLALVAIWLAGRLAVTFSAHIGWIAAMSIDLAFLAAIVVVIGTEIAAGKNWRNLKVLAPLGILLAANAVFHLEAHFTGVSDISRRLAMAAAITLIMLIGGRIIPSFTRNWLVRENPGRLPAAFGRFDGAAIAAGIIALAVWIAAPEAKAGGLLLVLAAAMHLVRLARWAGDRTLRDPLVAILHAGYLFIPAGFGLLALASFMPGSVPQAAGIHALGAGAVGSMTLAVMVRATLGHTGQALKAGSGARLLFGCVIVAALARIAAAFLPGSIDALLHVAAFAWLIAFAGFGVLFAKSLATRRR
jgi:uncharacterized protein involved in response to NO